MQSVGHLYVRYFNKTIQERVFMRRALGGDQFNEQIELDYQRTGTVTLSLISINYQRT